MNPTARRTGPDYPAAAHAASLCACSALGTSVCRRWPACCRLPLVWSWRQAQPAPGWACRWPAHSHWEADRRATAEPLPENDVAVTLPLTVWFAVNVLAAANCGTLVVSRLSVVLPPNATEPPPVRSVPADTVSDGFASMALLTPPVAMLSEPLVVMGPPVRPAPLPTLVTVPLPAPGKVCPLAKLITPLLATESPVSAGVAPFVPNRRSSLPDGELVSFPTGSASQRKSWLCALAVPLL